MKVIVTGGTGFLGTEILRQCVANPRITSIIALARRDLAPEWQAEKKITTLKVTDFGTYSPEDLKVLEGAEGCFWALGTTPDRGRHMTNEELKTVNEDWPTNAAKAWSQWPLPDGDVFRFVFTSGSLVPDPANLDQKLWFGESMRKGRAYTEQNLLELAKAGKLDAYITKPGFITTGEPLLWKLAFGKGYVSKEAVTACYLDLLFNGNEKKVLWNPDLRSVGAEALKKLAAEK
ncbi:uncharacterized protein DFL_008083 [Arthrobotrys flagrans]|uniref:NAD(P)-binding domain-containing protein n=1 Tax=Arthrobotrys flagrans TaxID=97331 RepID=A0A436ZMS2_ARTFL|nr:hypothetical protein DFL_008083 [Arthrobotrys flagrans]